MVTDVIRSLVDEPAVPDAPRRVWRDWFVAAAIVVGTVVEVFARDLPWEVLTVAVSAVLATTVFWRRTHPLATVIVAFGTIGVFSVLVRIATGEVAGADSMAWVLVVPYAAFRWGSGRACAWSVPVMIAAWIVGITTDPSTIGEALGGLMVLAVAAGAGVEVRQVQSRRRRAIDDARIAERAQLARELHDTVAHHVSAIAIQAQAGQAVAATNPEATVDVLRVIEEAASRTLAEMRSMVGALRGDDAELAPQQGIVDIARLAGVDRPGPTVTVTVSGGVDDLRPSIDAAVYRIAQESITNAARHAIGATTVDVSVFADDECVRLTVVDDGRPVAWHGDEGGYGLAGMKERAKLLGGVLSAGPAPDGGWRVDAILPRRG